MDTKQIFADKTDIYISMKLELMDLSNKRLAAKLKRLSFVLEYKEVPEEILKEIADADALVSVKIRQITTASFYMAAAYGCEFSRTGDEEDAHLIACADRIREPLFYMLENTSLFDLVRPSEGTVGENEEFYFDLIDMGNIYTLYFEDLIVTPKLS